MAAPRPTPTDDSPPPAAPVAVRVTGGAPDAADAGGPDRERQEAMAWIGLGGNLGDVASTLAQARRALTALGCGAPTVSGLFRTSPWRDTPGPGFLNQVMGLPCRLAPEALLDAMLALEAALGRSRPSGRPQFAPRTLDLDLLAYGDTRCDTARLTLPHPRLADRRFVLLPWATVAPDWPVPLPTGTRPVADLLADCPDAGEVTPCAP